MTVTTMIAHPGSSWLFPRQFGFRLPESKVGPTPAITTAASLRVGQILHFGLKPLLNSYFESRGAGLRGSLATLSWARFCSLGDGGESGDDFIGRQRVSKSNISGPNPLGERQWTNVLLALNVAMYIAQVATRGKLMLWGAKINGSIDDGQLWRLVTSAFLHSNIGHLLVNCYSLNAVGPSVEKISGPGRYLAVYFASAIAGSTMSYFFSNDPAVGASGAIFGLVGSTAVFIMRHRGQIGGGRGELQHIVNVIAVNMAIGLLSERIDNWGHLGGLLGGVAASWLLGPAWDSRTPSTDGRRRFADRAPIFYLINKIKRS